MDKYSFVITINQNYVEKIMRKRKHRVLKDVDINLSLMPQDVPVVKVEKELESNNIIVKFIFELNKEVKYYPYYCNDDLQLKISCELYTNRIVLVEFPADKLEECIEELSNIKDRIEDKMNSIMWEGKEVAKLDILERQLDLILDSEFVKRLEFIKDFKLYHLTNH